MTIHFDVMIRPDECTKGSLCRIEGLLGRVVVAVEQLVVLATPVPKPPITGIGAEFEKTPSGKPE